MSQRDKEETTLWQRFYDALDDVAVLSWQDVLAVLRSAWVGVHEHRAVQARKETEQTR